MAFVIFWFFGRKHVQIFSSIWWGKERVRIIRNCWSHMRHGRIWFLPKLVLWLFPGELRWPWRVFVPHLSPQVDPAISSDHWNLPPRFYGAQRIAQWRRPSSVAFWTHKKDGAAFRVFLKMAKFNIWDVFFWILEKIWWILNGLSCKYSWLGCIARGQFVCFSSVLAATFGYKEPQHLRFFFRLKRGRGPISPWKSTLTRTDIYIYVIHIYMS